jgi:hypothetical protein
MQITGSKGAQGGKGSQVCEPIVATIYAYALQRVAVAVH